MPASDPRPSYLVPESFGWLSIRIGPSCNLLSKPTEIPRECDAFQFCFLQISHVLPHVAICALQVVPPSWGLLPSYLYLVLPLPRLSFFSLKSICDVYGRTNNNMTIQRALEIARNSESAVDPNISAYLWSSVRDLWAKLEAAPDSYLMDKDEFALFTYFRYHYSNATVAESAIRRFWDNYNRRV